MRVIIQRVKHASVTVDTEMIGQIEQGFLLFVGIHEDDEAHMIEKMVSKITQMRIFEDADEKMNLSLKDVGGALLSISQFTLYADCKKGNRPGFSSAAKADKALEFYDEFNKQLVNTGIAVETGEFGADMKIELLNDGPVTIILDSGEL